jgi:hypothetical protein
MIFLLWQAWAILSAVPQGTINLKQKMKMNYDSKLMKLVPAGVVLAAAVFLGCGQEKVNVNVLFAFFGFSAVIALMVVAAIDYRRKRASQGHY